MERLERARDALHVTGRQGLAKGVWEGLVQGVTISISDDCPVASWRRGSNVGLVFYTGPLGCTIVPVLAFFNSSPPIRLPPMAFQTSSLLPYRLAYMPRAFIGKMNL